MQNALLKQLKDAYQRVITSIAFLPAIIALMFLGLSILMIQFDFSPAGKNIKSNLHWLSLKDASTARSICSSIAAGVISLAVFSFSMVMILLSQAASQMSNRILGKLISNRFQQVVLGFYIGTIVYALFLLSTIRDTNSGIYVPAISTYLLITLTIVDIFLFIYFLHYITQSVKFETIIHKIYDDTKHELKKTCTENGTTAELPDPVNVYEINASQSGLYHGFEKDSLIRLCEKEDATVYFNYPVGTYVMENTPILRVASKNGLSEDFENKLRMMVNIGKGQDIHTSYYFGLRQLMEIGIKALSPGMNDSGTATLSLQAIVDLVAYRMTNYPVVHYTDKENKVRVVVQEKNFDDLFDEYILPIWDYGREDRLIQQEMLHVLLLLDKKGKRAATAILLEEVRGVLREREASNVKRQA